MILQNCAVSSITPFSAGPEWNRHRVLHLYRRLGFGASEAEIQAGLAITPSQLVDQLLDTAVDLPPPTPPTWADWDDDDYDSSSESRFDHYRQFENRWLREMITESIRSKIALFWHGHFVTELDVYECTAYLWRYYNLLHVHAFGNFKTFVEEMGKTPAMLVYLNGNVNKADEPNENYARELLELFTLGANNGYTSEDIINIARALTGWEVNKNDCTLATIDPTEHDFEEKVLFGQTIPAYTGVQDEVGVMEQYDLIHNILFTERENEIAIYICEQIYKHFVYPEVNPDIINALAATFLNPATKWEILPVLRQLFKSEHFFDETFIGGHIKSPVELFAGMAKAAELQYPANYDEGDLQDWVRYCDNLGQLLFEPTDVSGWDGYRAWINENTMTNRWGRANQFLYSLTDEAKINLRDTVLAAVQAIDPNDASLISQPEVIAQYVINLFINRPLEQVHLDVAVQYLKAGFPDNYYEPGGSITWTLYWEEAPDQIINMLVYLSRLPEFQMN